MMRSMILGLMAATMLAGPAMADNRRDDRRDDRRYDGRDDRRDYKRDRKDDRRNYKRDVRDDRRDWYRDQRHWRPVARDDWRWAGPRHRGSGYVLPRGYGYRPLPVGYRMPPPFFARSYWIDNPRYYRLPPAYRGAHWVRYGPDALLIQIGNGLVLQAVRGVWF